MPKTILTVDDSLSMRQAISYALRSAGYDVIEACDGVDAMSKIGEPINMVLTDLNMPNMDGIELIKQIRTNSPRRHVPIVMLTTESQAAKKEAAKAAGATAWIVKPFKPDQLLYVINRVLP